MKVVKKSISVPKDLFNFAQKRASVLAKERGATVNFSGFICELLAHEKREKDASKTNKPQAAAA